jgi:uncharacterized delta-60 repeat protein
VARLNDDGSPDTSFGTGGQTTISFGSDPYELDIAAGVAIDSSGRLVVAGTAISSSLNAFAVARLNTNGSLDAGFGTGGKTTISFSNNYVAYPAAGVALDPTGRIVVAGTTYAYNSGGGGSTMAVARLNAADGSLDQTFGSGGEATAGNFGPGYYYSSATRLAIDSAGRIAVAGNAINDPNGSDFAAVVFKPNGVPDVDFGVGGKVTTDLSGYYGYDTASGAAFDSAGRLVVAGTTVGSPQTGYDFAVVRYLGHDRIVEAGSATFAADLQSTATALRTTPPPGTPRVVIHVSSPAQMPAVTAAIAGLSVNPSGPAIEVLLDVDAGTYRLGSVTVPAGLKLLIDGAGGAAGEGTFASSSGPVLTLVSGNVIIRDGAQLSSTGSASTIVVQSGQLTMRNSTVTENTSTSQAAIVISGGQVDLGTSDQYYDPNLGGNTFNVNGPGMFIRLPGPNNVLAFGDTFAVNGANVWDYQLEDRIDHSLDGLGGGTVFWAANNVFVSDKSGSIQRGVNVVPVGGTVNVQTGVQGGYAVGSKLLAVAFQNGPAIIQQADSLDLTKVQLVVVDGDASAHGYYDYYSSYSGTNDSIKFTAGTNPGEVQLKINNLPSGTFVPSGRLVAFGGAGANISVDGAIVLPAWLYGGGNGRLSGGSGNNVLIGGYGELLAGGSGRSLMIGSGNDRMMSRGGQDIIISGFTFYAYEEMALAAIMAEWTSADSLAARVANLTDNTASSLFSANRKNGNDFLIGSGPNRTVYSDGSSSTVSAGSGLDLIFVGSTDKVTGLSAADVEFLIGN